MSPKQNLQKKHRNILTQSIIKRVKNTITKRLPLLRFLATVLILMLCYYTLTGTNTFSKQFLPVYLSVVASVTSTALSVFGFVIATSGTTVSSQAFSMNIAYGCDALEPSFLFAVVVLAFPTAWKKRIIGALSGVLILFGINIIRLITLFLTGTYKSEYFELMHIEIWQALFIILALILFVVWLSIAERTKQSEVI